MDDPRRLFLCVQPEAQRDQVETAVSPPGAVPVDDPGDRAVHGEQVAVVKVLVHDIVPGQTGRMTGADRTDPAFEGGAARAVKTQRLVKTVAGAVVQQIQVHRRDVRARPAARPGIR